jgi:hypothetical protein
MKWLPRCRISRMWNPQQGERERERKKMTDLYYFQKWKWITSLVIQRSISKKFPRLRVFRVHALELFVIGTIPTSYVCIWGVQCRVILTAPSSETGDIVSLSRIKWKREVIRLKRIYNFWCSMLVFTPFASCFVTLCGTFMHFLELTYWQDATVPVPCFLLFLCFRKATQEIFSKLDETSSRTLIFPGSFPKTAERAFPA